MTKLNLLVLYTADLQISLAFYKALGLQFVEEQHGSGPIHYACEQDGFVIEIYPGKAGNPVDRKQAGAVMLGFHVADLNSTLETLKALGTVIVTEPKQSDWGLRAVVQDPDGRSVDLSEPTTSQ